MHLDQIYKDLNEQNPTGSNTHQKPVISLEVFPPKNDFGINSKKLLAELEILKEFQPTFVSVTYGAGGSNQGLQRWQQAAQRLQQYQGQQAIVIQKLATQLAQTTSIALQWLEESTAPLDAAMVATQQAELALIRQSVDEEIMALAPLVHALLQQCPREDPD